MMVPEQGTLPAGQDPEPELTPAERLPEPAAGAGAMAVGYGGLEVGMAAEAAP